MLWLDTEAKAPPVCQLAFERWRQLNPDWTLRVLDHRDLPELLADYPEFVRRLPAAAISDIVRIELLAEIGGIWIDATVLPACPLADWLPDVMQTGFFAFDRPGADRPLSSWFLAAQPGHPIILKWREEVRRYWTRPRQLLMDPREGRPVVPNPDDWVNPEAAPEMAQYPYFWFHYLFGYLAGTDPEFSSQWAQCPKLSAQPPHQLQKMLKNGGGDAEAMWTSFLEAAPLQKLKWDLPLPEDFVSKVRNQPPA
jgi:hypothetical protein